ncbi:SGNH/GDSL hydrolase family protein [Enterococcus sp. LJL99]
MKRFFKDNYSSFLFFLISGIGIFLVLLLTIPKAQPLLISTVDQADTSNNKEVIHYVAIGDSLTEGIGDSTNSGGFVPLVSRDLEKQLGLNGVQVDNFGKNGDRSDQILKRIKKNEEIQKSIASADVITLTFGGNDLMKVVKGDIFSLTEKSFNKPLKAYQKGVKKLLDEVRTYNEHAPIYVVGIYNPFYLYFPEISEMQDIVNNWNKGTEEVVDEFSNAYFIPINDLLYKGSGGDVGIVSDGTISSSEAAQDITNDALYEEDHFHPNNLGYQIMASTVRDEMLKTKDQWLPKETSVKK